MRGWWTGDLCVPATVNLKAMSWKHMNNAAFNSSSATTNKKSWTLRSLRILILCIFAVSYTMGSRWLTPATSEENCACFAKNMCPSLSKGISQLANHSAFFKSFGGDNTRYAAHSYLTQTSVMFEVGGYTGVDILEMRKRFGYFRVLLFEPIYHRQAQENLRGEQVEVYPYGLGTTSRDVFFDVSGDGTHLSSAGTKAHIKSFASVLTELNIGLVHLLQINCEGCEWDVLEAALEFIHVFQHIQVQFHPMVDWIENRLERYAIIQDKFTQTHELVFDHPWIWQLWRIK